MIKSSDVGSLPFFGDAERFLSGAMSFKRCSVKGSSEYFERIVVKGFIDKIEVGIDVPSYPQFRDMNRMFLGMIDGVEETKEGHIETNRLSLKADSAQIPEVAVIRENAQRIYGETGRAFKAKVCVTGPYTLSSFFVHQDKGIFRRLGQLVAEIVANSVFDGRRGGVELVTVDEPVFGLQDDPLIDYGSEGRENLRAAWESVFHKVRSKRACGCLHLHNTANDLFWEVDSLDVVESHMDDPIYEMKKTKEQLESTDKFLKASLCTMNFDRLIENRIVTTSKQVLNESAMNQEIAEIWRGINDGKVDPAIFVDNVELMKERLMRVVRRFGVDRIPYAGPECGLKGFPSYDCALECLRMVSGAVANVSERTLK